MILTAFKPWTWGWIPWKPKISMQTQAITQSLRKKCNYKSSSRKWLSMIVSHTNLSIEIEILSLIKLQTWFRIVCISHNRAWSPPSSPAHLSAKVWFRTVARSRYALNATKNWIFILGITKSCRNLSKIWTNFGNKWRMKGENKLTMSSHRFIKSVKSSN